MDVIGKFENAFKVMKESEHSQLMLESKKRHIKLAPKYIGNLRVGVAQHLSTLLSRADKMLDGFLVAYSNIKVQQALGKIVSDQPCIHFDVLADFIMFKPTIGCKLIGKVNKVAKRHIGCLVHDHFNAWILHTKVTETHAVDKLIGSEMEFTVQDISTNRNVLSIKGRFEKFISYSIDNTIAIHPLETHSKQKKKKKKKDKDKSGDADKQADENEELVAHTTKKKKKHKNYEADTAEEQCTDSQEESISGNHVHEESNGEDMRKKRKKDQKKKKHKNYEADTAEEQCTDSQEENISGNHVHEESNGEDMRKKRKKDKKKKSHKEKETVNGGIGAKRINDSIASLTSCEPLLSSTQCDEDISSASQLHSLMNGGTDLIVEDAVNDTVDSVKNNRLMHGQPKQSKSRKRHHDDNSETYKLLSIAGLATDSDWAMPSPIKKHKRHKEKIEALEGGDSSIDCEDSSSLNQTKKSKKKHKAK